MCVFFPSILDIKFVGRTSRGHTGGRSHRIFNPPSFCGACLDFCREKDSAIPFPRRPWSRILCTPPVGHFYFVFLVFSEKNPVCRDRTHVPTCQKVTRCQLSYRGRPATYTVLVAIIIPKTETLAFTVQQHSLLHEGPSISCSTVRSAWCFESDVIWGTSAHPCGCEFGLLLTDGKRMTTAVFWACLRAKTTGSIAWITVFVAKAKMGIIWNDSMVTLWVYWWGVNQSESRARQNPGEFPRSAVRLTCSGFGL